MTESSHSISERSRKNERAVLHALAEAGQSEIAKRMDVSESTVSRMKDGQIAAVSSLLAACGLKVVPEQFKCIDPAKAQAMVTLYEAAMARIENPVSLLWGDE
ncbi:CII family transcriptional regulator [Limnohabitans sp.]|uniref:CII family transcriptional regulator n=1 Tax=Limnohabitans sp. TaxID=1907725 RepID=UPI00286EF116|nr:CII family transcriptional regulator [Limnohabitans sp.]